VLTCDLDDFPHEMIGFSDVLLREILKGLAVAFEISGSEDRPRLLGRQLDVIFVPPKQAGFLTGQRLQALRENLQLW
jgi:hypothetical protein